MRVLVAQLNPTVGDLEGNTQKILRALDYARSQEADVVLFSELVLCGYPPEDLLLHPPFIDAQEKYLEKIVQASARLLVIVGMVRRNPEQREKPLFNSAAIIQNGKLLGFEDKRLLPTYDVFDERRYFEPGKSNRLWEYKGKKIGVLICEDIWQHADAVGYTNYAEDPVSDMKTKKPDVLFNLSASPYQFHRPDARIKVGSVCAKALHCPVVLCCQIGCNDQIVFDGYSTYLDPKGQLVQIARGFEEDEMLIDLDAKTPPAAFTYDPIKDLYHALVLGVRDYFHKQGFKKGCLGLSGGIDSALVACIGVDALGKDNVLAISMPSRYSSRGSVVDAEILARNLGIELMSVPIEKPFQSFLDILEPHFRGKAADVTEENLQARIRGMILMAISNKFGSLVLNTGNKSELGLGYCTLYGDMCGALAVLGDVSKLQIYELSRWVNREKEIIPQSTIDKIPSAELKPNQKDTDFMPPYEIVDRVLQDYVEEFLSPEQIAQKHRFPLATVVDLVHRVHCAEYKRQQAAPCIRVTKKAFRVGRRYPIVQKWVP